MNQASGLARAFFYTGARALLVSHWAVDWNGRDRTPAAKANLFIFLDVHRPWRKVKVAADAR